MKVPPPDPIIARTITDITMPECFEGPGLHPDRYGRPEGCIGCSARRHNRNRETIESILQRPQANSPMARAIPSTGHTRSKLNFTVPAGTRGYFHGRLALSNTSDHRNKRMARGLPELCTLPHSPAAVKPAATIPRPDEDAVRMRVAQAQRALKKTQGELTHAPAHGHGVYPN